MKRVLLVGAVVLFLAGCASPWQAPADNATVVTPWGMLSIPTGH